MVAVEFSLKLSEKISKPFPFNSAGKLETQNGIKKNLNTWNGSACNMPSIVPKELMFKANPTKTAIPKDLNQISKAGSKYLKTKYIYQIKKHHKMIMP